MAAPSIRIDLSRQELVLEESGNILLRCPVSSGKAGRYPAAIPESLDEHSDFILTRILWLDGLEPHNANTRSRYIYIHGTNNTDLLGAPASHGCIRLSPRDMLDLFALAEEGMDVFIQC